MPTVINDIEHIEIDAAVGERWALSPDDFDRVTGWTLKPEGMCRGDVCAPIYRRDEVLVDGRIDLAAAAPIIGMSAVVDVARGVGALGVTAERRGDEMATLRAPDFTLPDRAGEPVSLHDFAGRKVLLLAWSSW